MKYIKEQINIPLSVNRKFYYIFTDKQKRLILDEMTYYKSIYKAVEDDVLFESVVNKHLKIKLHKVVYPNIINDVRVYKKMFEDEFKDIIIY
jgi:predicted transposase